MDGLHKGGFILPRSCLLQVKLSDDDLTMILAEASKAGSKGDAVDQVSLLAALDLSCCLAVYLN